MNVRQIIDNAITLCGLGDNPDKYDENNIYIRYLNMVYLDVIKDTLLHNIHIKKDTVDLEVIDGVSDDFDIIYLYIFDVRSSTSNTKLYYKSFDWSLEQEEKSGVAEFFYLNGNKIYTYPKSTETLKVTYVVTPKLLDIDSVDVDILIPEVYHSILLDGLVFRIMSDESGDHNQKVMLYHARFQQGINELNTFFANMYGSSSDYSSYREL